MTTRTKQISTEAANILRACYVDDNEIKLPDGKLARPLYLEVNAALESLGGKWHTGRRAHVYAELSGEALADAFYDMVTAGAWSPPQRDDYFPTPDWLARRMVETVASNVRIAGDDCLLEPSAGDGAIIRELFNSFPARPIDAVELRGDLAAKIDHARSSRVNVATADFMEWQPENGRQYAAIVMNPPFSKNQSVRHVERALTMLQPGGVLVAILPSSIVQRQDRLYRSLRQAIMRHGSIQPVEDDAFRDVGTRVRTVLVFYRRSADAVETPQEPKSRPESAEPSVAPRRRFATPKRTLRRAAR